ncbi:MAG TPA: nucleotidyltransferase family protein, partial [Methanocorpusculum sp.]|nr:nucleotidyltransferase family protein [Methanocorpusculum sp.]
MDSYTSIRLETLETLKEHLPEMQAKFGVETLDLFGSVARGDDTPDSDIDILYTFAPGKSTLSNLIQLGDYLEDLFHKKVGLVGKNWISPHFSES